MEKLRDTPDSRVFLFAYGTLQTGENNHGFLAGAQCVGAAQTVLQFSLHIDLDSQIPYLTEQPTTFVSGELYMLPDAQSLAQIDWLEGHPRDYQRKLISVNQSGRIYKAWCYLWHHEIDSEAHVFLNTGNYKDRQQLFQKASVPIRNLDCETAWAA